MKGLGPYRHYALALIAPLTLAGCAALGGLEKPPRVTLLSIEPLEIALLEQRYLATVRIQNPNPVDLPISGLDYAIHVNDSEFANGVSSQRVTVPAYGETTVDLGVSSTLVRLFEQLRGFAESGGSLRYSITGTIGLQGVATPVPFEQRGQIELRRPRPSARRAA